MLAGFLLAALFKIRKHLRGTDFNSNAMIIHIVAVFLTFITGFVSFLFDLVLHIEQFADIVFLVSAVFGCTVSCLECYIFV